MPRLTTLAPRVIDALYAEALVLFDEARTTFQGQDGASDGERQIALSCEALRTTSRMMQAIAWLLNLRALSRGEVSEAQVRRHGPLARDVARAEPARLALLPDAAQQTVAATETFYARLLRLEEGWQAPPASAPLPALERLRARLARGAFAGPAGAGTPPVPQHG